MATLARRIVSLTVATSLLTISIGCGGAASTTTPSPVQATDTLTGTVAVGGSAQNNFTVAYSYAATDVVVTIKSLTSVATGAALSITIGLAIGTPAFDGSCTRSSFFTVPAAVIGSSDNTAQTAPGSFGPNTYCIAVFDPGTGVLTESAKYTVTVVHY